MATSQIVVRKLAVKMLQAPGVNGSCKGIKLGRSCL